MIVILKEGNAEESPKKGFFATLRMTNYYKILT